MATGVIIFPYSGTLFRRNVGPILILVATLIDKEAVSMSRPFALTATTALAALTARSPSKSPKRLRLALVAAGLTLGLSLSAAAPAMARDHGPNDHGPNDHDRREAPQVIRRAPPPPRHERYERERYEMRHRYRPYPVYWRELPPAPPRVIYTNAPVYYAPVPAPAPVPVLPTSLTIVLPLDFQ